MKDIENALVTSVNNPQWPNLLVAVDSRVEKTLAVLRLQAFADYRAILSSLRWPPSIFTSGAEKDKDLEGTNPLVLMQGEKKEKYTQSFFALCALQNLQAQRDERKRKMSAFNGDRSSQCVNKDEKFIFDCQVWAIDELVHPIVFKMEYHFSMWRDQPKFVFTFAYKITRDFVDVMETVLQPLIDCARMIGFSAKEAWVSAMSRMLIMYLRREILPKLSDSPGGDGSCMFKFPWLYLVDIIISYDKRIQNLQNSENLHGRILKEVGCLSSSLSVMSIFSEHHDWLLLWAGEEINEAIGMLNSMIENEKNWFSDNIELSRSTEKNDNIFILSTCDDYKAPLIADYVTKLTWSMIEKGQALPIVSTRLQFLRSTVTFFLNHFFDVLLKVCEEIDSSGPFVGEDKKLLKFLRCLNTARYCESVVREWSQELVFLDICSEDQGCESSFFEAEIHYLVKFEADRLEAIMSNLLLNFEDLSWDYVQNRDQWGCEASEGGESATILSPELVESLYMLNNRMRILHLHLNSKDFLDLWRSIADALDYFIFTSIISVHPHFSIHGGNQFKADMAALFSVFQPFCTRPEAFFPRVRDSLRVAEKSNPLLRGALEE